MAIYRRACRQDGRYLGDNVHHDLFRSQRLARGRRSDSANVRCSRWGRRIHSRCTGHLRMDMDEGSQGLGNASLRSASGRIRSFVTVRDFFILANCYAELNGQKRSFMNEIEAHADACPGSTSNLRDPSRPPASLPSMLAMWKNSIFLLRVHYAVPSLR